MPHTKRMRPLRRTAALLCAALAGLGLAAGRAAAQVTGPLPTSPPQPTPFQSPLYHSGGANTPYDGTTADAPYITPLIDPIQGQLQGTPTELYNSSLTQIPSFLLGNYDPTQPPAGLSGGVGSINTYYPNHFADGDIYSWSAPFSYVVQSAGTVTADDSSATAPSSFTATPNGAWATISNNVTFPSAGTATNGEYLRLASGVPGTATWTLAEPTAGTYSLYFHIPNDLPDANGVPEARDTQVTYFIAVRDAGGNVTNSASATASQTEANDTQFLAGPLQVVSGGSVTVTLTRSNTVNNNADYLVADSMTLQQTVGDVQSAPTAITRDLYPNDFNSPRLQYWGVYVPPTSTNPAVSTANTAPPATDTTPSSQAIANANPDTTGAVTPATAANINVGNIFLKTGNPLTALGPPVAPATAIGPDPLRLIRQLVYFGRSDPAATRTTSLDDSQAGFSSGPATTVLNTTASNGEYKAFGTQMGNALTAPVASWTLTAPAAAGTNNFFVYVHIPAKPNGENRLSRVFYTVAVTTANGPASYTAVISQQTQGTDALVALPIGAVVPVGGSPITISLYNVNGLTTSSPAGTVVVADSVTISTGTGQGAIYCVDGFTGSVVWRFETPGSANGASAPVFASPAIARINVLVSPAAGAAPAVYANKLVVIVGDNNGLVYCLDAIGNGDGTSNVNVLAKDAAGNPIPNEPITAPQPAYGTTPPALVAGTPAATVILNNLVHVGTTGVYWIYRPDANRPKYVTGTHRGQIKPIDPTTDLPVPAAFNTASPNVFVDPSVSTTPDANGVLASNATVYIGSSNGVLYALDALGQAIDGTSAANYTASGDTFNVSQLGPTFDIPMPGNNPFPLTAVVPSPQPRWWFSLRGVDPNSASNTSSADIESAPAIFVRTATVTVAGVNRTFYTPTVYIGSAHELDPTSNVGRLYALNGIYGPSGNNGRISPLTQPSPLAANYTGPGSFNYNVGQVPQISKTDTADWSFPDANNTKTGSPLAGYAHTSSTSLPRPALGNMTGSPVVFTNLDEGIGNVNADGSPRRTRIYVAADSGQEYPATSRPDDTQTGRLWAVNLDGSVGTTTNSTTGVWAYPAANDPNNAKLDTTAEPYAPIGSFLRGTPAIGFVQYPATTTNGDGSSYNPTDAVHTAGVNGLAVPMLYIGTRGVNDSALYGVNIDGDMTAATDQRTIFRLVSPDGSIYQSSPALVSNASSAGGNGGGVYAVAGNTLYDYGATPISNPNSGQAYPLYREDRAFVGFGPISSPALAGADTTDLSTAFLSGTNTIGSLNNSRFTANTTDWVYVGDSSTGLCRGITPNDPTYGGIAVGLGQIIPYDANAPSAELLNAFIQTYLVKNQNSKTSAGCAAGRGSASPCRSSNGAKAPTSALPMSRRRTRSTRPRAILTRHCLSTILGLIRRSRPTRQARFRSIRPTARRRRR